MEEVRKRTLYIVKTMNNSVLLGVSYKICRKLYRSLRNSSGCEQLTRPLIKISDSSSETNDEKLLTSQVTAVYLMCVNSLSSFLGTLSNSFGGT